MLEEKIRKIKQIVSHFSLKYTANLNREVWEIYFPYGKQQYTVGGTGPTFDEAFLDALGNVQAKQEVFMKLKEIVENAGN